MTTLPSAGSPREALPVPLASWSHNPSTASDGQLPDLSIIELPSCARSRARGTDDRSANSSQHGLGHLEAPVDYRRS
jgi:hypothetical protein